MPRFGFGFRMELGVGDGDSNREALVRSLTRDSASGRVAEVAEWQKSASLGAGKFNNLLHDWHRRQQKQQTTNNKTTQNTMT